MGGLIVRQLKEMAERLPEGHRSNGGSIAGNTSNILNQLSNESYTADRTTLETESTGNSSNQILPNGTKPPVGQGEWVVHDEPGVYITLSSLPGGGTELKRVRFRYYTCHPLFMKVSRNIYDLLNQKLRHIFSEIIELHNMHFFFQINEIF